MELAVWNLISFNKISTIGNETFLFIIKCPTAQGNLISEAFLKLMKFSFSTMSFCLISSSAKILGVINTVRIYGSFVIPYTLMIVPYSNKNQSPILFSGENCRNYFIIGNTLGNLCWKNTLYTSDIKKFIYLKNLLLISSVKTISGNSKFSSLKNKNILTRCDWNMKCLVLWNSTSHEWIFSPRNSSYLRQLD